MTKKFAIFHDSLNQIVNRSIKKLSKSEADDCLADSFFPHFCLRIAITEQRLAHWDSGLLGDHYLLKICNFQDTVC